MPSQPVTSAADPALSGALLANAVAGGLVMPQLQLAPGSMLQLQPAPVPGFAAPDRGPAPGPAAVPMQLSSPSLEDSAPAQDLPGEAGQMVHAPAGAGVPAAAVQPAQPQLQAAAPGSGASLRLWRLPDGGMPGGDGPAPGGRPAQGGYAAQQDKHRQRQLGRDQHHQPVQAHLGEGEAPEGLPHGEAAGEGGWPGDGGIGIAWGRRAPRTRATVDGEDGSAPPPPPRLLAAAPAAAPRSPPSQASPHTASGGAPPGPSSSRQRGGGAAPLATGAVAAGAAAASGGRRGSDGGYASPESMHGGAPKRQAVAAAQQHQQQQQQEEAANSGGDGPDSPDGKAGAVQDDDSNAEVSARGPSDTGVSQDPMGWPGDILPHLSCRLKQGTRPDFPLANISPKCACMCFKRAGDGRCLCVLGSSLLSSSANAPFMPSAHPLPGGGGHP